LKLIFDDFFNQVVNETNRYAHQTLAAASTATAVASATARPDGVDASPVDTHWTDTTLPEIKAYIAMNIAMGLRGHTVARDIWSVKTFLNDPCLSKIMTGKRFEALSRFFHIANNTSAVLDHREVGYDPMHKVRPMIDLSTLELLICTNPNSNSVLMRP
jgi:hypothetical protein